MSVEKTYAEVLRERKKYPLGKPRPYTPYDSNSEPTEHITQPPEDVPLFSRTGRFILVSIAMLAVGYGVHGLMADDLYLPAKRSAGTHYHGYQAWLIFGMILNLAGWLMTWAFDSMDVVTRKTKNRFLHITLTTSGIAFMVAALAFPAIYG